MLVEHVKNIIVDYQVIQSSLLQCRDPKIRQI